MTEEDEPPRILGWVKGASVAAIEEVGHDGWETAMVCGYLQGVEEEVGVRCFPLWWNMFSQLKLLSAHQRMDLIKTSC